MIIAGTRIRTRSGHHPLAQHVWRGAGNADVVTLQGDESDLEDMVAVASHASHAYAIRHYHISPGEPTSDVEATNLIGRIGAEFGFGVDAVIVVRHQKDRRVAHDGMLGTQGYEMHWHAIVAEVDPVTGRVLDSRQMYPRHERLARDAELRLLHKPIKGRFNISVLVALEARGDYQGAQRLREAGLEDGAPAYAAYSARQRRVLERCHGGPRGGLLDLPTQVRRLNMIWLAHSPDPPALVAALRHEGLHLRYAADLVPAAADEQAIAAAPARRGTTWLVDAWDGRSGEGYVLGVAHRLLREPRARVAQTLRSRSRLAMHAMSFASDRASEPVQAPQRPRHSPPLDTPKPADHSFESGDLVQDTDQPLGSAAVPELRGFYG